MYAFAALPKKIIYAEPGLSNKYNKQLSKQQLVNNRKTSQKHGRPQLESIQKINKLEIAWTVSVTT